MKKLFVIDLDGTALKDFSTLHPKTIEGVKHLLSLGHDVVIATGRSECACKRFYDELGLKTPLITSNGAEITHPFDPQFPSQSLRINSDVLEFVISEEMSKYIDNLYYYCDGKLNMNKYYDLLDEHLNQTDCIIQTVPMNANSDVVSLALITTDDSCMRAREKLEAKFPTMNFSSWDGQDHEAFVEVSAPEANKWYAVQKVAKYLNVELENVYTFGDAENDYMMIKECQNGIATGNATEHLKAASSKVLSTTNEEGCVGEYFLTFK